MFRRVGILVVLALTWVLAGTALAQEPVSPTYSDPTWRAYYWNNMALSGAPVLEREETDLNHDWGTGSPHPNVNADRFSARWTRFIFVAEDTYRFTATSDDGLRVWVDDELIIDEWHDHAATTFTADRHLTSGHHWVVVEFYENRGVAVAKASWGPAAVPVQNWRGEYWNNTTLSGVPALVRDDAEIDFNWGGLSPDPGVIKADYFSARWARTMDLPAGRYRFSMTVDDGGRLWVDDRLLIDAWREQPATTYTAETYLPAGAVPIRMEYYEKGGKAVAKLKAQLLTPTIKNWRGEYWNNPTLSGTPALVRDDAQIDFAWGAGSPAPGVIDTDHFSVRWTRTPDLSAGRYRFTMTVDDGARLWVDNRLLIDAWRDQAATTYTAEIDLPGGPVPIKMEYYENAGLAVAQLSWSRTTTTVHNWRGEYFTNTTLSSSPALVRDDAQIDFAWGAGSPAPGVIGSDRFSVRWTRTVELTAGRYRFSVTVDDGARLWVDNRLLIDTWRDQAATTYNAEIDLPSGLIPIKMEYYENAGLAVAQLSWSQTPTATDYWRGEYHNNMALSGSPSLVRDDRQIDFNWGSGSPAPGTISADHFSVRWTRTLNLSGGQYRFSITVDDGARLWVNDHLLIDTWRDQAATTYTGEIQLPGGPVRIKMEYYENTDQAVARLSWALVGKIVTPGAVIVDDTDPGFTKGGSPSGWRTVYDEGYGGRLLWTWNNDWQRPDYNWARWQPQLTAGRYQVFVFIPERYTTTTSARYLIAHADGHATVDVDQSTTGDQWVSLGTYRFTGTVIDGVTLTDATGEPRLSRLIAFDAVKWVPS